MQVDDVRTMENYWKNHHFFKYERDLLKKACTTKELKSNNRYQQLVVITNAIEKIYNELDESFKKFIDVRYWGEYSATLEYAEVADEIDVSLPKIYKMRTFVMIRTAEEIGYIGEPAKF